uniref:Integrator complex subunit 6 like n=1 Tax=Oryzias sinensis TaxID=183150 RepID=A0A8C7Z3I7_9TELE
MQMRSLVHNRSGRPVTCHFVYMVTPFDCDKCRNTLMSSNTDTSASMNQRTYLGTTYLDVAKGAVEVFMKLRARDPASRGDRYMLVTFDEPPYGVKAGWKENHATFMCELKNLQASGLTTLGHALRTAFDLLNLNRLVSGIDNYGQVTCSL